MNWGFLAWGSRMYLNWALFQERGSTKRPVISTNSSKRPVTDLPTPQSIKTTRHPERLRVSRVTQPRGRRG